jgi:hypothetical protein
MNRKLAGPLCYVVFSFPCAIMPICGAAEGVIFERKLSPDILKRWELRSNIGYLDKMDDQQLAAKIKEIQVELGKTPNYLGPGALIKAELRYDAQEGRYYTQYTFLHLDTVKYAECIAWVKSFVREHHLEGSVPGVGKPREPTGRDGVAPDVIICSEETKLWALELLYPENGKAEVYVNVVCLQDARVAPHEWLRAASRAPKIHVEEVGGRAKVISYSAEAGSEEGWVWPSGKQTLVRVEGRKGGKEVRDFLSAEFPSSVPQDYKVDRLAWSIEEVDLWLSRMKALLEQGDPKEAIEGTQQKYQFCIGRLRPAVECDLLRRRRSDMGLAGKREEYDRLRKWWDDGKASVSWDEEARKVKVGAAGR